MAMEMYLGRDETRWPWKCIQVEMKQGGHGNVFRQRDETRLWKCIQVQRLKNNMDMGWKNTNYYYYYYCYYLIIIIHIFIYLTNK